MKAFLVIFQFICVLSNLVGLPGNLISLISPISLAIWGNLGFKYLAMVIGIVLSGEILEFLSSIISGKYFGLSKKSIYSGIACSIVLGIVMAPIMFGIGAVIGTFIGAFLGTFIYEFLTTKNLFKSLKLGAVSLTGKITGTVIKIFLGFVAIYITYLYG